MPGRNKHPLLGWHPPASLAAWARAEAQRRGVRLSVVLTEALTEYRARSTAAELIERGLPADSGKEKTS